MQVQQGCDHRCTFCIIPFGRGPSRSVPAGAVVQQVRMLVEAGYQEVVLTGVDIVSYGADLPGTSGLGQLVRRVLALAPDLPRLRLSSLDPNGIDPELWRLLAEEPRPDAAPHLSVQAGSDLILKRMKRRHSRQDALAAIARARTLRPGLAVGADVIAGFPTETEALFAETLAFVDEAAIPYLHVFPYSERPGTPAARMPAVAPALRRERAARLRAASRRHEAAFHAAQLGREVTVLAERGGVGHTEHFAPVRLSAPAGSLVQALVTGMDDHGLLVGGSLMALGFPRTAEGGPQPQHAEADRRHLRRLRPPQAGRRRAGRAGGAAARRPISARKAATSIVENFRRTRFGRDVTDTEVKDALAEEIAAILEPVAKPLVLDPARHPHVILVVGVNGNGKDHHDRQAGPAIPRAGPAPDPRGGRHVPRRRRGAVADLGRAHRRPRHRRGAERGRRRPCLRRAGQGAGRARRRAADRHRRPPAQQERTDGGNWPRSSACCASTTERAALGAAGAGRDPPVTTRSNRSACSRRWST